MPGEEEEPKRTPENNNHTLLFSFPTNGSFRSQLQPPQQEECGEELQHHQPADGDIMIGATPATINHPSGVESLPLFRHRRERHEEQQPEDLCDFSVTPMTSRPHNCSFLQQQRHHSGSSPAVSRTTGSPIHRRVRSRSLGQVMELSADPQLFLPYLQAKTTTTDLNNTMKHSMLSALQSNAITKYDRNDNAVQVTQQLPDDENDSSKSEVDDNDDSAESSYSSRSTTALMIRMCILYGMINATIVLPVLMSFTSIIYRDDAFGAYIPILVKLTIVSGIVHQLCFSTFSSMPFAVGQVQDAGLIFLSGMASTMVQYCQAQAHDDITMISTVTVGLSLATALLGLALVGIGQLKLAQRVQQLPTW